MKCMIFSVSAGGGHSHAANALKEYILSKEPYSEVKILDTIKEISPVLDKVIIGSYLKTIQYTPSIFGKLYNFTEDEDGLTSYISSKFNQLMSIEVHDKIKKFNPDILIATHPFAADMIGYLKRKNYISLPTIVILTDYASHSSWIHQGIDHYIVSNEDMKKEILFKGVDNNSIHTLGIPINPSFFTKFDEYTTLKELNLYPEKKTILIMGGSLGMGKISELFYKLSKSDLNAQLIVISGKNKNLYTELMELSKISILPSVIIGYTNEVNKLMQASDLLLTKPGGLTITESLASELPMGIFSPLPGQEIKNKEFLLRHNLAIDIDDNYKFIDNINYIISNNHLLNTMKENTKKFAKPNSTEDIYTLIRQIIKNKQ